MKHRASFGSFELFPDPIHMSRRYDSMSHIFRVIGNSHIGKALANSPAINGFWDLCQPLRQATPHTSRLPTAVAQTLRIDMQKIDQVLIEPTVM